jgi:hypothetical protein
MNETNEILILGSIALDTIETKFGKKENLLGGSATYATIGAGFYGSPIPIGIVGDDFPKEGDEIFNNFSSDLENIEKKMEKHLVGVVNITIMEMIETLFLPI